MSMISAGPRRRFVHTARCTLRFIDEQPTDKGVLNEYKDTCAPPLARPAPEPLVGLGSGSDILLTRGTIRLWTAMGMR